MHLGIINFIKGLLGLASSKPNPAFKDDDDNKYIRGPIGNRGPCPGLNSLANSGYIPRDGKNITQAHLANALETALHMTPTLSAVLVNSVKPLLRKDGTFDLVDVRIHNVLEHDGSFTRHDIVQGDNFSLQPTYFEALLKDANNGPLTLKSLAKTFRRRHKESREVGSPRLPLHLWFVSVAEAVAFFHGSQLGKELPLDHVRTFYLEERFPDAVLENKKSRTVPGLGLDALELLFYAYIMPWS
ncbi:Cloroperoxidase, partial [Mollisia scopiformis]